LSITSHELRSPMTPMKAQLQMLQAEYYGKLTKKQKESVDIVLRNTSRLDNIILDFLEISRIEAARLKFRFKKTNLIEPINRLVEEMKGFMPEKSIKIETKIDKLPTIEVDSDRVMQILRNLVNNAKKFSKPNGKIFIRAILKEKVIEFCVKDEGIGISQEGQQRIFEPFFQAEQTMYREHGGTGLGLAICKGIIESQNGKIWVESKQGEGSIFFFTIPLQPVREIKAIKLLFSPKTGIDKKVKELFIELLGPLGEGEFNLLKQHGLRYEDLMDHLEDLKERGIIDEESMKEIDNKLALVYNIQESKKMDIPKEVRKLYLETLGPLGKKRFEKLGILNTTNIIKDINELQKVGIVSQIEANSFRDNILRLFRQKTLNKELE